MSPYYFDDFLAIESLPPQPPRCCHRAATVALCAAATLRAAGAAATAADAAAATAPPPGCRQRRAVALPPLPHRRKLPTSAVIARHAMTLFLNTAETPHNALSRSEASDLLRSIDRRIEARVSEYGIFILASPLTIAFASMWGSLGSQSAVAAFGCAMERHGIIVVAASALATAGHQDGGESTRG